MREGDDRVPAMGGSVRGAQERLIADRYLLLRQLGQIVLSDAEAAGVILGMREMNDPWLTAS